jgi:hypothetical protein
MDSVKEMEVISPETTSLPRFVYCENKQYSSGSAPDVVLTKKVIFYVEISHCTYNED